MTVQECLLGVSAYPIPEITILEISVRRGLTLTQTATTAVLQGKTYRLALADLLMWLSEAPNVSQGGQSYSFSEDERARLRRRAQAAYDRIGDDAANDGTVYGYKGSRL